jgi:hypothetical protein
MSLSGSPLSENTSLVGSSVDSPDRRKGVLPVCGNRSGQGSYTRLCPSPTLTPWDRLRASNDDPREGPEPSNAKGLRPWSLRSRLAGLDDLDLNLDRHVFFDGYHLPPIVQRGHQTTPKLNTPLVLALLKEGETNKVSGDNPSGEGTTPYRLFLEPGDEFSPRYVPSQRA